MTKEDKELLFKDLCARLPYQPKLQIYYEEMSGSGVFDEKLWEIDGDGQYCNGGRRLEDIKPYLRPMSSMTEDEFKELKKIYQDQSICSYHTISMDLEFINWYLAHHFDINYLIQSGLAIEVTENNNPYKE